MMMNSLALSLVLVLPAVSALSLKEEDTKQAWERINEELHKNVLVDPDIWKKIFTEDGGVSLNGAELAPPQDVFGPFYHRVVKADHNWDFVAVADSYVMEKGVKYIEYDNGCSTLFRYQGVGLVEDGKIAEYHGHADSESMANLIGCMPKGGDEPSSTKKIAMPPEAVSSLKEEENKMAWRRINLENKAAVIDRNVWKKIYTEDARVSINGADFVSPDEAFGPFLQGCIKHENEFDFVAVTDTHVMEQAINYIEYEDGCSAMFRCQGVGLLKDGKIAEYRAYVDTENMANLMKCLPKKSGEKPTEKLRFNM